MPCETDRHSLYSDLTSISKVSFPLLSISIISLMKSWQNATVYKYNMTVKYVLNKCVSRTDTNPTFAPMNPRGGRGTSADIVPAHIKFGMDPSTRCWDIAQKPPECKHSPLTPTVTKISFPPFSVPPRGPLTPKGEKTSGTRVRPHAKFGMNQPAGCREIVDKKNEQKQKKQTYSKTNT